MRLTQKTLEEINKGEKANIIKADIIKGNDRHPGTVQRWIDNNDEILTSAKNLSIICEHLGKNQNEILEEEKQSA